jgi:hypothetical protein
MSQRGKLIIVVLVIVLCIFSLASMAPASSGVGLCYVNDCIVNNQNCHCCIQVEAGFECYTQCGEVKDCR